jgi:hypothetical protein
MVHLMSSSTLSCRRLIQQTVMAYRMASFHFYQPRPKYRSIDIIFQAPSSLLATQKTRWQAGASLCKYYILVLDQHCNIHDWRTRKSFVDVAGNLCFEGFSEHTAVLILPNGTTRETLLNERLLRDCAKDNSREWYAYLDQRGRRVTGEERLFVVTSTDKTDRWGLAASSDTSRSLGASLKFSAPLGAGTASFSGKWENRGSTIARASQPNIVVPNQTVMIGGFFVKPPRW